MTFTDNQWAEDADRMHKWPLPEGVRSQLLSPEQTSQALNAGEDPVQLSIRKWEALQSVVEGSGTNMLSHRYYSALQEFIGMDTCALCLSSTKALIAEKGTVKAGDEKCGYCPFAKIDQCTRDSSVFEGIGRILRRSSTGSPSPATQKQLQSQLSSHIVKMIANLKLL